MDGDPWKSNKLGTLGTYKVSKSSRVRRRTIWAWKAFKPKFAKSARRTIGVGKWSCMVD